MLYVTTRSNEDTYTAHRALTENRSPDGGFYVPMRMPSLDREQIESLAKRPFNQCIADVLNMLFGTRLTVFDVDFSIGRQPVRLNPLSHRITLGETWHNLDWDFERIVGILYRRIAGEKAGEPTDWFRIALRIGVLFGFMGKLMRRDLAGINNPVDVAVLSGDFSAPMAAWYARSWGLPIGNIILCCNDNNNPWELLHHGEMRTNVVAVSTSTPDGDFAVPTDLERFVHSCGGVREVGRYLEACRTGRMYIPSDLTCGNMRKGITASVVGQARVASGIPNVYRTHDILMDHYCALIYSGLLDYRASNGETKAAMILWEKGPGRDIPGIAGTMGMTPEEIKKILKIK